MRRVRYSVIAAQQRIWVSSLKDDYTEIVFDAAWEELLDEDTITEVALITA